MKNTETLSKEEKLLLLLQMFIERLKKSGFAQDKIIKYIWLFCVGYYIKYYLPQSKTELIDRFTIISMLSNALKTSSARILRHVGYEHEVTFLFRYLIHYVIKNEQEAEDIYLQERAKYEKEVLLGLVEPPKKKRQKRRI